MTSSPPPPPRPELPEGLPAPPPQPLAAVPVWVPFAVLASVFVVIVMIAVAVGGIVAVADPGFDVKDPPEELTIGLTLMQDAALVAAAWIAVRVVRGRASPAFFGLRPVSRPMRAVLIAGAVYVGFWVIVGILTAIFGNPPEQELVTELKEQQSVAVLAGFAVLTCVVAPLAEEVFFRGFMFTVFVRRIGPAWASLVVGAIFGLVHAPNPVLGLVALGVLGVGLCILYWTTQSIIPCMALHALNNSISFGVTKELPPWLFAALAVASVAVVVSTASAVAGRAAVAA